MQKSYNIGPKIKIFNKEISKIQSNKFLPENFDFTLFPNQKNHWNIQLFAVGFETGSAISQNPIFESRNYPV